jgi:predicted dehydrogenase
MPGSRPTLLVVGAGDRGTVYSTFVQEHPHLGQVVAVADIDVTARQRFAQQHAIPPGRQFGDWREALASDTGANAVVLTTQDRLHTAPAVAFVAAGYHLLLEKPMAPTAAECREVVAAVERAGVHFAVAHVLRYTAYTRRLVGAIRDGAIGEVVGVQRLEPVGWWHFAHSYVRGSWRREAESSSILLAKCCHDLDWIRHVVGAPIESVSSFAGRFEFRAERRPQGAADRCLDCQVEPECPYSATRLYVGRAAAGDFGWPVSVVTPEASRTAVIDALRQGPYGRCVYSCDNDVPDHQVVNLKLAQGRCCSFTMSAFTPFSARRSIVFGTRGWLVGDGEQLEHVDFVSGRRQQLALTPTTGRHGGGDDALMRAFLTAVADDDPSALLTGPRETLETHLAVFAAERARHENRVVELDEA